MAILEQLRAETVDQAFAQWGLDSIDVAAVHQAIQQQYPDDYQQVQQQFDQAVEKLAVELVASLPAGHVRHALLEPGEWEALLARPLSSYDTDNMDEWLRSHLVDRVFDQ